MQPFINRNVETVKSARSRILAGFVAMVMAAAMLVAGAGSASAVGPGTPDTPFNQKVAASGGLDIPGMSVAIDSQQRVIVGGQFSRAGETETLRLARFNSDGTPDTDFN